jgi:glycosyltransferase involved in cell wall biosynthesis
MKVVENSTNGRGIELRLIGEGPLKSALVDRAKALKLANVRFEDPVPKSAIPSLAAEADAFVFNLIDAPVFKYGISSNKLYDFMAAARPVLFCCASANNPIEEANSGFTVPPEDPRALAEAILKLAAMPSERRAEMGLAGRRHLEANYDMRHLAKRLAMMMDEVLEEFRN